MKKKTKATNNKFINIYILLLPFFFFDDDDDEKKKNNIWASSSRVEWGHCQTEYLKFYFDRSIIYIIIIIIRIIFISWR